MFEEDEDTGSLSAMHHPFTSPKDLTPAELTAHPVGAVANAYDMVINGYEVGGGSVRIHRNEMQQAVFSILGITPDEQREIRFLIRCSEIWYTTACRVSIWFPDRLVMLLTGTDNIP